MEFIFTFSCRVVEARLTALCKAAASAVKSKVPCCCLHSAEFLKSHQDGPSLLQKCQALLDCSEHQQLAQVILTDAITVNSDMLIDLILFWQGSHELPQMYCEDLAASSPVVI